MMTQHVAAQAFANPHPPKTDASTPAPSTVWPKPARGGCPQLLCPQEQPGGQEGMLQEPALNASEATHWKISSLFPVP